MKLKVKTINEAAVNDNESEKNPFKTFIAVRNYINDTLSEDFEANLIEAVKANVPEYDPSLCVKKRDNRLNEARSYYVDSLAFYLFNNVPD